jgi:hypothetical protein
MGPTVYVLKPNKNKLQSVIQKNKYYFSEHLSFNEKYFIEAYDIPNEWENKKQMAMESAYAFTTCNVEFDNNKIIYFDEEESEDIDWQEIEQIERDEVRNNEASEEKAINFCPYTEQNFLKAKESIKKNVMFNIGFHSTTLKWGPCWCPCGHLMEV